MNKKTVLIISIIIGIIICCTAVTAWGIYSLLNNPTIKESLNVAEEEFSAMFDLRQKIIEAYPCEDATVQLMNGNSLNISLINSEFNDTPKSQQAENAREIAIFVKDNYTGNADIERIMISFVENNKIGPVNANTAVSYVFDISELE